MVEKSDRSLLEKTLPTHRSRTVEKPCVEGRVEPDGDPHSRVPGLS